MLDTHGLCEIRRSFVLFISFVFYLLMHIIGAEYMGCNYKAIIFHKSVIQMGFWETAGHTVWPTGAREQLGTQKGGIFLFSLISWVWRRPMCQSMLNCANKSKGAFQGRTEIKKKQRTKELREMDASTKNSKKRMDGSLVHSEIHSGFMDFKYAYSRF